MLQMWQKSKEQERKKRHTDTGHTVQMLYWRKGGGVMRKGVGLGVMVGIIE